jgi:hypothetical protein
MELNPYQITALSHVFLIFIDLVLFDIFLLHIFSIEYTWRKWKIVIENLNHLLRKSFCCYTVAPHVCIIRYLQLFEQEKKCKLKNIDARLIQIGQILWVLIRKPDHRFVKYATKYQFTICVSHLHCSSGSPIFE